MLPLQRIALSLSFAALLTFGPTYVGAAPVTFTATLDGLSEATPNDSPGTGLATVTFDIDAHTMRVVASFSGLTGTTTASHIHCCTTDPGQGAAGVATTTPNFAGFPLGVTSGSMDQTLDMTLASSYNPPFVTAHVDIATSEQFLFQGMLAGESYFNIHTSTFGGGEIRGFLQQVQQIPEPQSIALAVLGLLGLGWTQRRRSLLP
jgi:CHRD domain/PEP-CTERM motif